MQVRVLFFGILKDLTGRSSDLISLPNHASAADVISMSVRENKCRYMIQRFLSVADADRALRGFRTCPHDIRDWARRCATEIHQLRHGRPHSIRALNDLDFIGKKAMSAEPSKTVLINVLTATRRPFAR